MATPHVAGVAALALEATPGASPATVAATIVNAATTGVVGNPGSGSPNRLLYSLLGGSQPPPSSTTTSTTLPPPSGCSSYPESFSGTLSGTGDADTQPNGTYYFSNAGVHRGCLDGPNGVDFDLYLQRWNGFGWSTVASSTSSGPDETVTFNGSSGYYRWRIVAYSGAGSYTFGLDRP
jgi:hypothetical protein